MISIILTEWKIFLRNKLFTYSTIFFVFSLLIVVILGTVQNKNQQIYRTKAQDHIRMQWENLDEMNPHRAAHYGSYAFKPLNTLNSMDSGVDDITGNVIKLEGHIQNEIVYSDASQSQTISKFGKLKSSLILQYVIPLFLIFLSFNSMSNERDSKRLKLLLFQGVSLPKLVLAKSISVWIYGMLLLIITVAIQIFCF